MRSDVPIIPRRLLFGNPTRTAPSLSHDGRYVSYLAPVDGVLNVWVAEAGSPDRAAPVTRDRKRGIRNYFWAYDPGTLIYMQDRDGDENWQLFATDSKGERTRPLTPYEGVRGQVQHVSHRHPANLLVGLNKRRPEYHDVYNLDLRTGALDLVVENDSFAGFVTDDDYRVRVADRMLPDGGRELLLRTGDGHWLPFMQIGHEDALTTGVAGFDGTGTKLYMVDSRGRDTAALFELDLNAGGTGPARMLADDSRADAGRVVRHPVSRHAQAVSFTYDRKRWQVIDPAIEPDFACLAGAVGGDFDIASRTLDDSRWIVEAAADDAPTRFYLYDRSRREATLWFTSRPDLEGKPLARMHSATLRARDGLNLVAYYSLPPGSDRSTAGKPDRPLPTVLLVHGGPWARDHWGFNSYHQWLANRGYAVVSVNFRGSTGFGKRFLNAGNLEWGRKMHDDLVDTVEWAVANGIADRSRTAIMGGSYGGYSALVGLSMTPDLFACGIDLVGPSNLITLLRSIPPYWKPVQQIFRTRAGDPDTPEGVQLLRERSPLTHVGNIRRPLLIGQGKNDPRVKQAESDQIVNAMKERGIPVTYLLYPDEGHGFGRPENSLAYAAVTEAFLGRSLGGKVEPVGDDFKGSSITVPVGADYVPGLTEALASAV
jgi:dipeptidyl aminopeptidase/acylaminoacyl peptidase